jgi:hypothetical protein
MLPLPLTIPHHFPEADAKHAKAWMPNPPHIPPILSILFILSKNPRCTNSFCPTSFCLSITLVARFIRAQGYHTGCRRSVCASENMVPEVGVEPTRGFNAPKDFKSFVSAIPPLGPGQDESMYATVLLWSICKERSINQPEPVAERPVDEDRFANQIPSLEIPPVPAIGTVEGVVAQHE